MNLATIDRLFIATNVQLDNNTSDEGGDKALSRCQFFEVLVRLGNAKFKEPGIVPTHSEALSKVLMEHVFPYSQPHPW